MPPHLLGLDLMLKMVKLPTILLVCQLRKLFEISSELLHLRS